MFKPESSNPLCPISVKSKESNRIIDKNNCPIDSSYFLLFSINNNIFWNYNSTGFNKTNILPLIKWNY